LVAEEACKPLVPGQRVGPARPRPTGSRERGASPSGSDFFGLHPRSGTAEKAKKRHIAAKLNLNEERLRVRDIGAAWGGLGLHLARPHKASVVGINLSDEQLKVSSQKAAAANVPCEFRKCDREMTGTFDRIVSVGRFEHVGKRDHRAFFKKCHDLLTHGGMMLPPCRAARHRCAEPENFAAVTPVSALPSSRGQDFLAAFSRTNSLHELWG
jgi:cyclopropane fatty-acyl-phospholipid synthase-like methyltransferase